MNSRHHIFHLRYPDRFHSLLGALFLLCSVSAWSQDASIHLEAEKNEIFIGEQMVLRLEIKALVTEEVRLPVLKDTLSEKVEIVEISGPDTIFPDNDVTSQILTLDITITSFDSGYQVIPPITAYTSADSVSTNPFLLTVRSVPLSAELKDIKGPIDVRFSIWEWLQEHWTIPAGILLLAILIFIYIRFFHGKKAVVPEAKVVETTRPAHEIALDKLENVKQKKLWQNDRLKEYHSEISEVLREYLENRYQVNALEQTSDEIFHNLRYLDIPETAMNRLRQVLLLSDMVKFAKEKPISSENELSMSNAIQFVEATRQKLAVAEDMAGKENEPDRQA